MTTLWKGPVKVRSAKNRHFWRTRYLVLSTSTLTVFKSQSNFEEGDPSKAFVIPADLMQRILTPEKGKGGASRVSISIFGWPQSLECIAGSPEEAQTLIGWGTALEIARAQRA